MVIFSRSLFSCFVRNYPKRVILSNSPRRLCLAKSLVFAPATLSYSTMGPPGTKWVSQDIIKSAEDQRSYCGMELENGMKVLLVSDPTTDKSSAAMDVHVGSMLDPKELPGLAHFCEHMLFLGTEKYPEENEYSKFLNEHGGSSNAFTSAEHTNYFFDVTPDHLKGALDRFAQFFLCPLFTASATDREVNAVNSENDKNLQSDTWRMFQLEKSTSKPDHDFNKFGTGNKETLDSIPKQKGINVRDELLKFHEKYYSANIMGLTVLGKESLEELTDLVVPLFSKATNKDIAIMEWNDHPFGPNEVKKLAHIIPVKDLRSLNVTWPIPDLHNYYQSNPGHYLGHLIGHEGPGSLLSELKSRGWVNTLVGGQKSGAKGFMFFILNVDLSEEGIEHVDDIVTLIFQYLNMLRKEGAQKWVYEECRDLNAMQFRFKDKEKPCNYTCHCAAALQEYPMKDILSGGILLEEYRPDLINMILEKLTTETIRVAVIGQKFQSSANQKEKWYGTEYSIANINANTLEQWRNAGFHDNLKMPLPNEFIPTNFELVTLEEKHPAPCVLRDTDMTRLWYRQDDKYLLPKACVSIEMTSPYAYMDPLNTALSYMFVTLFRDALNEYAYAAELAGLNYDLHNTVYGLTLNLRGYNDKQHVLLQRVMEKMTNFEIDPQRFDVLKENYIRALKNFRAEQPYQHAVYYTAVLTSEQMWTKEELLEAAEELTLKRVQDFIPVLLSRIYMEILIYGNVSKQHALKMTDIVEETLKSQAGTKPLLASQQRRFREIQIPDDGSYVFKRENEVHKSSALMAYYQCSLQNTESNMIIELFCQIISEPCFDQLRTKEQLGYIVFSGVRRASGVQGLRIIVQSDREPVYVESRVEAFLHSMEKYISEMSDEQFKDNIDALAARRLEQPKKMSGQNAKYWSEIVSQQYNFDRDNIEVECLKSITKENIMEFYKHLIASDSKHRHKVSVHVKSTQVESEQDGIVQKEDASLELIPAPTVKEPVDVDDVNAFKRGLALFPLPEPYVKISSMLAKL